MLKKYTPPVYRLKLLLSMLTSRHFINFLLEMQQETITCIRRTFVNDLQKLHQACALTHPTVRYNWIIRQVCLNLLSAVQGSFLV